MERTITIQQIKDVAQEAYNLYKDNTDGKNADYIPYLANIDPKLFGISICLMNGEIIQLGDSQYRFGIESVSTTRRKQRCQVESHRRQYDRTMRKYPATDRRTVPVRVGDKFQQPFHRLAIEKL